MQGLEDFTEDELRDLRKQLNRQKLSGVAEISYPDGSQITYRGREKIAAEIAQITAELDARAGKPRRRIVRLNTRTGG